MSDTLSPQTVLENKSSKTAKRPNASARFFQRCNSQNASRLTQLPAEIRLKVLRLLLKHPGYLEPVLIERDRGFDPGSSDDPIIELSAQLLACCQSLHKQAWPILYGENILRIVCQSASLYHSCYILGSGIQLHCNADDMPADDYDLISLMRRTTDISRNTQRLLAHWNGLSKIKHIHLTIGHALRDEIFVACRAVHRLLRNKNVLIRLLPKHTRFDLEDDRDLEAFRCSEAYRLKGCRILRSRTIRFEGNMSDLSDLVREIEGSTEPPKDIFPMWKKANEYIRSMPLPDDSDPSLRPYLLDTSFEVHRHQARVAIDTYDVFNAQKYIVMLLKQALDWTKKWAEHEAVEARRRQEIMLAVVEESKKTFAESAEAVSSALERSMGGGLGKRTPTAAN